MVLKEIINYSPIVFLFGCILLLIIIFFMFIWFFLQVRKICKVPEGFIKFGQITFILSSWCVLIIILFYYIKYPRDISVLNIFLTVIVGFLGTGVGFFFSGEALKHLERKVKARGKLLRQLDILDDTKELIKESIELQKKIEKTKK